MKKLPYIINTENLFISKEVISPVFTLAVLTNGDVFLYKSTSSSVVKNYIHVVIFLHTC
jgi:hypothetical protein